MRVVTWLYVTEDGEIGGVITGAAFDEFTVKLTVPATRLTVPLVPDRIIFP